MTCNTCGCTKYKICGWRNVTRKLDAVIADGGYCHNIATTMLATKRYRVITVLKHDPANNEYLLDRVYK